MSYFIIGCIAIGIGVVAFVVFSMGWIVGYRCAQIDHQNGWHMTIMGSEKESTDR